ncbi:hypothetical protein LguiA_010760 [Lonicera macranthoides]
MENSIANELYSEILQSSNVKLGPIPATNNSNHLDLNGTTSSLEPFSSSKQDSDDGDVWHENGSSWNGSIEEFDKASDMDREWQRRRNQFHTIGYRDGVTVGKEASAQEGFNIGFKESVFVGFNWGLVRGVTSALACLPEGLREKMLETEAKRNKFHKLYESTHSLSTADALRLFHADLSKNLVNNSNIAEPSSPKVVDLDVQSSDGSPLKKYHGELQSLIVDTPAVKVHFEMDP